MKTKYNPISYQIIGGTMVQSNILFLTLISLVFLQACSTGGSRRSFSGLSIGMTKAEVEDQLGRSWEISKSASGNGEVNHVYGEAGYVWYNEKDELKGFGSYVDLPSFSSMEISRASGYQIKHTNKRKIYFHFEPYTELKSNEAKMVFLENKKHIEKVFLKLGYQPVSSQEQAEIIVVTKLGISDPKVSQEVVSRPVYNFNYAPAQQATTNVYGSTGSYLGSAKTTYGNPYGSFTANYAGQNTQTITNTTFLRSLEFIAIDKLEKNTQENLLWSSIVVSEGSSDDIRQMFPYLLYASLPIINKSQTFKSYGLAGYHTGVFEIIGAEVPKVDRTPAGQIKKYGKESKKCNTFLTVVRYQGCD